ncbi:MAG: AAA family ATPase [Alphaproteobacteria bacterium]|nr:AAA family ATPase [Alphaproteobacteria bacterium]
MNMDPRMTIPAGFDPAAMQQMLQQMQQMMQLMQAQAPMSVPVPAAPAVVAPQPPAASIMQTPVAPSGVPGVIPSATAPASPASEDLPIPAWDAILVPKPIRDVFGLPDVPENRMIASYERSADPRVPYVAVNPRYKYRKNHLRMIAAFLHDNHGDTLLISGPHGSGKTTLPAQMCAVLGIPLMVVTGRKGMEVPDLIGRWVFTPNGFKWADGPLTACVRHGWVLILNEAFLVNPGELTGLNDIAEGNALCLAENGGEVVHPHPKFRLILTDNSGGQGDASGMYAGVLTQNPSLLDRMRKMVVGYPDQATELSILKSLAEQFGADLEDDALLPFLRTATDIRSVFEGAGQGKTELTVTMSTRTLRRWLYMSFYLANPDNPEMDKEKFALALDHALTAPIDPAERVAIHEMAAAHFGKAWKAVL